MHHGMGYNLSMKCIPLTVLRHSAPLVIAVFVLWGCDWPPTFGPEYYISSTNYIESYPLAAPPSATDDGSTVALDSSGRWDWAWRGQPATGNTYQYMTLTAQPATSGTSTDGDFTLADGASVWRLELPNLFLNGDFEAPLDESAFTSFNSTRVISAVTPIHQNSLEIDIGDDADDYVAFRMGVLLDDIATTATMSTGGTYQLRMLLGSSEVFKYKHALIEDIASKTSSSATPDANKSLFIAERFTYFDKGYAFVAAEMIQKITIDEVRAVRTDLDPYLRLLLAPADTYPTLVKGQYEFSVWMRTSDADKTFSDASRTSQPYAARNATLRLRQVARSYDADTDSASLDPTVTSTTVVAVDSTWRRYVVRLQKPNNMEVFDESTPFPVLELAIAPTLEDPMDAGAVLIAAPELNFYINGF